MPHDFLLTCRTITAILPSSKQTDRRNNDHQHLLHSDLDMGGHMITEIISLTLIGAAACGIDCLLILVGLAIADAVERGWKI